ncbi:Hypothetical predicted protein [Octopus vulgaris]|uniref:Uncharacterized protein n=1 Tax=Octopus vulgaris TaxID=6645 RepID=A0AA36BEV3_OCTVU|nr:Hypothetical predicted protein [Octopus vulgaris]
MPSTSRNRYSAKLMFQTLKHKSFRLPNYYTLDNLEEKLNYHKYIVKRKKREEQSAAGRNVLSSSYKINTVRDEMVCQCEGRHLERVPKVSVKK